MIEVNTRTAFAAFLALGLVTMMVGAPAAGAATTTPTDKTPGQCLQVYLFELSVGPVKVDASDTCPEVTVDSSSAQEPHEVCVYPLC